MVEILQLPPLILHPFSGGGNTDELLAGSKASLALNGMSRSGSPLSPDSPAMGDEEELFRRVLTGRDKLRDRVDGGPASTRTAPFRRAETAASRARDGRCAARRPLWGAGAANGAPALAGPSPAEAGAPLAMPVPH